MTHIKRSRRLQAGLAGLSVVSAFGAAVGLGLTTHTGGSATANQTSTGSTATGSHAGEGDDDSERSSSTSTSRQSSPVTQPSSSAPQATTSGS